jgi:hypothetical protein
MQLGLRRVGRSRNGAQHSVGQFVKTGSNTCDVVEKSTCEVVGDTFFTDGGEGWMIR